MCRTCFEKLLSGENTRTTVVRSLRIIHDFPKSTVVGPKTRFYHKSKSVPNARARGSVCVCGEGTGGGSITIVDGHGRRRSSVPATRQRYTTDPGQL